MGPKPLVWLHERFGISEAGAFEDRRAGPDRYPGDEAETVRLRVCAISGSCRPG